MDEELMKMQKLAKGLNISEKRPKKILWNI